MVIALNLKFDQLAKKLKAIGVYTKVGGLVPTKPRTDLSRVHYIPSPSTLN